MPIGLYWDEIAILVDAKSVAASGLDMHGNAWYQLIFPSYGDYKLPVYLWLASLSVKIFGASEWAIRLPSLLAGLVTVLTAGYLARLLARDFKLTSQPELLQLATMLVVTLSPWSIGFSRTAFEGHVAQALVGLSAVCLVKSWKKIWWLIPAILLGALATYTYFSVRYVWPVVAVMSQIGWLAQTQEFKKSFKTVSVSVVGLLLSFGLLLLPMLNSPLYNVSTQFRLGTDSILKNETQIITSNVYRELSGNSPLDRVWFHRLWLTGRELLINYADNTSPAFLFVTGDPNLRHGTGEYGLFLLPMAILFVMGLYRWSHKAPFILAWLVLWWAAALLPASVPQNTPHALRSLNALIPLSCIIGLGLAIVLEQLDSKQVINRVASWLLVGWITISAIGFGLYFFTVYPITSAPAWQGGYRELAQATLEIGKHHQDVETLLIHPDDRFYLWIMAYGPFTATDFHSWKSKEYQFKELGSIKVAGPAEVESRLKQNSRLLLTGQRDTLEKLRTEIGFSILEYKMVPEHPNDPLEKYAVWLVSLP